jgi:Polyketide cyclase / dehydrase and lipid transport
MHTFTTFRAETRTAAAAAPPEAVFAIVADGARLPEWAPAFASAAEREDGGDGDRAGERWLIGTGDARFPILLRADPASRTVDLLDPRDPSRGAFLRVLPNGQGAEVLFTLFFPEEVEAAAVDAQMATVADELQAIARIAEASG